MIKNQIVNESETNLIILVIKIKPGSTSDLPFKSPYPIPAFLFKKNET